MRRRFFQFRLRTLFVLVAIAAVPCGMLAWKMEHKRRERAAVAAIRELGGTVHYDYVVASPLSPKEIQSLKVVGGSASAIPIRSE
jgi:hypothetical protein